MYAQTERARNRSCRTLYKDIVMFGQAPCMRLPGPYIYIINYMKPEFVQVDGLRYCYRAPKSKRARIQ